MKIMRKMVVAVEGYTEFYFLKELIEAILGYGKVHFERVNYQSGQSYSLKAVGVPLEFAELHVMLVNCCGDGNVKSFILDRAELFANRGFTCAIGLQDLYPKQLAELERFKDGLTLGLDKAPFPVEICLAVMEIEAWFLNENLHFTNVDKILTATYIKDNFGFNPETESIELNIRHPSKMLNEIYSAVGKGYKKRQEDMHKMFAKLDYCNIYESLPAKSVSFRNFVASLENKLYGDDCLSV